MTENLHTFTRKPLQNLKKIDRNWWPGATQLQPSAWAEWGAVQWTLNFGWTVLLAVTITTLTPHYIVFWITLSTGASSDTAHSSCVVSALTAADWQLLLMSLCVADSLFTVVSGNSVMSGNLHPCKLERLKIVFFLFCFFFHCNVQPNNNNDYKFEIIVHPIEFKRPRWVSQLNTNSEEH